MDFGNVFTFAVKDVALVQIGLAIVFALFPITNDLLSNPIPSVVSDSVAVILFLGIVICTGYIVVKGSHDLWIAIRSGMGSDT